MWWEGETGVSVNSQLLYKPSVSGMNPPRPVSVWARNYVASAAASQSRRPACAARACSSKNKDKGTAIACYSWEDAPTTINKTSLHKDTAGRPRSNAYSQIKQQTPRLLT